jgi:hypothetical protein
LSKLQSSIWEKQNSNDSDFDISNIDDNLLEGLIQKDIDNDIENFKM